MRYSSEGTAVHARLRLDPDPIDGRSHPMRRLGLRAASTAVLVAALVTSSLGAAWPFFNQVEHNGLKLQLVPEVDPESRTGG